MIVKNVFFFTIPEAQSQYSLNSENPILWQDEDTLEITTGSDEIGTEREEEENR